MVIVRKKLDAFSYFTAGLLGGTDAADLPVKFTEVEALCQEDTVTINLIDRDGKSDTRIVDTTYASRSPFSETLFLYWKLDDIPLAIWVQDEDYVTGDMDTLLKLNTTTEI